MRIVVLNGSPKGNFSVTLQTVLYLQKRFPSDSFEILNVGQQIRKYEKDFASAATAIESADLILFAYPVYTFLAPSQLHRFIELLKANDVDMRGKMCAQITTSKHFYDMTAHQFIIDNCHDLGLNYLSGLSADMDDLLTDSGQNDAKKFWEYIHFCADNAIFTSTPLDKRCVKNANVASLEKAISELKTAISTDFRTVDTTNADTATTIDGKQATSANVHDRDIVIVTDCAPTDTKLATMIDDFVKAATFKTRIININDIRIDGGCLGCFKCAQKGKCVYKDDFDSFLRQNIQKADGIIYAFTIRDHSMGSRFKLYDDRQFCNGHRAVTVGMPVGYLINGDLARESNLQVVINGRIEVGHNFLAGIVTDTDAPIATSQLVLKLNYALDNAFLLPRNFYGVGGTKIFRDLIFVMRGLMKADHKFYKQNGIYDFPQKKRGMIFKMQLVGALMSIPKIANNMGNAMNVEIIKPYQKVINAIK